ncbi:hypothetical protein AgCh_000037 [Apium graveolens]
MIPILSDLMFDGVSRLSCIVMAWGLITALVEHVDQVFGLTLLDNGRDKPIVEPSEENTRCVLLLRSWAWTRSPTLAPLPRVPSLDNAAIWGNRRDEVENEYMLLNPNVAM